MRNRYRDARHPLVLGVLTAQAFLSCWQLWEQLHFEPVGSKVVQAMPNWSGLLFSVMLLGSSLACIVSAWMRKEPRGAKVERAGMMAMAAALLYYSIDLPSAVSTWGSTMALVFAGAAVGCLIRAGLVHHMIRHPETW